MARDLRQVALALSGKQFNKVQVKEFYKETLGILAHATEPIDLELYHIAVIFLYASFSHQYD